MFNIFNNNTFFRSVAMYTHSYACIHTENRVECRKEQEKGHRRRILLWGNKYFNQLY
jgi:hypothetical protein